MDRVTRLAASLFDVPIAVVSIVDSDRIWFKSKVGVDVAEVERAAGLCSSVVLQDGPWITRNARKDPRARTNPLVAGEFGLQFYAGAPLRTFDGHNLGAMCVIDKKPRTFTAADEASLKDLAGIVIGELELRLVARNAVAAERLRLLTERQSVLAERETSQSLVGENIATERWEDARHWISIYDDLIRFRLDFLDRLKREVAKRPAEALNSAAYEMAFIESQLDGYYFRLNLWYERLWHLQGLHIDRHDRVLRYKGRSAPLTERESDLLKLLLEHPNRRYTSAQIMRYAWLDSGLFPEQVRNYVMRIRKIFAQMEIPCDLINEPGKGYSLVFRQPED